MIIHPLLVSSADKLHLWGNSFTNASQNVCMCNCSPDNNYAWVEHHPRGSAGVNQGKSTTCCNNYCQLHSSSYTDSHTANSHVLSHLLWQTSSR